MEKQTELMKELTSKDEYCIILLDACRFDYFEEEIDMRGELLECITPANKTKDWIDKVITFLKDTKIYSGHPYWKGRDGYVKNIRHIWKPDENVNELGVTEPETVLSIAFSEREEKRLLHIVQPHLPFIEGDGKRLLKNETSKGFCQGAHFSALLGKIVGRKATWEELRNYYRENLRRALSAVKKFQDKFPKNTVITADHGEELGERMRYGHRKNTDEILHIPWFKIEPKT